MIPARFPVVPFNERLHDDQIDAILGVHAHIAEGAKRILGCAPTGAGKTAIAVSLARALGARTLFVAHREELLDQTLGACRTWWPETTVGRIDQRNHNPSGRFDVAMVQTLVGRLDRTPGPYDLIIVDEAHRTTADTYVRIIDHYQGTAGMLPGSPIPDRAPIVVGVTATPRRTGEAGAVYDFYGGRIGFAYEIGELITKGRLCDLRVARVGIDADLSDVKRTGGDYAQGDLGRKLTEANAPTIIADAWEQKAADRLTMVFCPTVAMSELVAAEFVTRGIPAAHVAGGTHRTDRRDIITRYRAGQIRVLCSVSTLTEGFDAPETDCIIMARPTSSEIVWRQAIGRGLRLHPGKDHCLVLDLVANSTKHTLATAKDLLGLHRELATGESARRAIEADADEQAEATERQERLDQMELEESWDRGALRFAETDAFGRPKGAKFVWAHEPVEGCHDRWTHTIEPGTVVIRRGSPARKEWVAGVNHADGAIEKLTAGPISRVITTAEQWVDLHRPEGAWRGDPATAKQLALLHARGIRVPDGCTKNQARGLIAHAKTERHRAAARKSEELRRSVAALELITAEAILERAGRRAMLMGTLSEAETLLGITVPTDWRPQAEQRVRQVLTVAADHGLLRPQGTAWIIRANERVAS